MDLDLLRRGLNHTKSRKTWVLALGALSFTGYGAYRVYHWPSVAKKRKRLLKLFGAFVRAAEMVSDSAEAIGITMKDLKEFIESDSDQIPNSLKQTSKITRSDEFSESLTQIVRALTVGILRAYRQETGMSGASIRKNSDFSHRVLDKLFSEAGSGFASVVVGSFARNLVMSYYSDAQLNVSSKFSLKVDNLELESESVPRWVNVIFEDKCRERIGDCVQLFVSTAVTIFLDKTMHINPYDELLSGMTNPKHETQVRDLLVSVCNDAIETLVKTSHQALMNKHTDATPGSSYPHSKFDRGPGKDSKALVRRQLMSNESKGRKSFDENQESGWMRKMSSTLAVPSNRKFVLDMTGRVTFETVRSFLEYLLERITECLKRSVDVIQEEVADRGLEAVKHVSRKSSAVITVCLSLCLHILNGPWILVPDY